jgi:hypothetical protein
MEKIEEWLQIFYDGCFSSGVNIIRRRGRETL